MLRAAWISGLLGEVKKTFSDEADTWADFWPGWKGFKSDGKEITGRGEQKEYIFQISTSENKTIYLTIYSVQVG